MSDVHGGLMTGLVSRREIHTMVMIMKRAMFGAMSMKVQNITINL